MRDIRSAAATEDARVNPDPLMEFREIKLLVIIPAYNEAGGIAITVKLVKNALPNADILVVNDGSLDSTGAEAVKAGARVVNLVNNLGIGGAVQTGYRYAAAGGYDYAVQIDGDGQHNPEDCLALLTALRQNNADMVVGSRFLTGEGFQSSMARQAGIRLLAAIVSKLTGRKVTDPTSGYRLCSRRAILLFAKEYSTDYPEVEALMTLNRYRFRFHEVPVRMSERQSGVSSISPLKSVYYMAKVILAVCMERTRGSKEWGVES
ncbi:glycosyltransferase family 2 protein [Paenibacillus nasutitermitis]|uniref:Glycosyl transferase n=1 Tax=Paenibacillus nasutitermitis TaxID=1652958 RepID=A0A916YXV3_9BACL|nr:glycosyltransferase family 2 protein [Paenibacillus nasutitermitis]GGD65769.1 putative glycosyl transferase [Paenibacillus nasutitermitis]